MIKKILFSIAALSLASAAWANKKPQTVIINNKAAAVQQSITAPALIPSEAVKLRKARESQEVKTEDAILKELEKRRLLDEQKRIDKLFNNSAEREESPALKMISSPKNETWMFGSKSLISFGAGAVTYPGVTNVNSTKQPAYFLSFGGYGYEGRLIFDLSLYYSKHYLADVNLQQSDVREAVHQPAASMAVKFSPLSGKMKPYVGLSGSLVFRKWFFVERTAGQAISDDLSQLNADVAEKDWNQSLDAGIAVGADLALGERLGLNVDARYHWNIYTENREVIPQEWTDIQVLDEVNSLIISAGLRYYF